MRTSFLGRLGRVTVALAAIAAASSVAASGSAASSAPHRGGTYTVGWEGAFGFSDNFDPTGEYLTEAMDIDSNLLVRTLVGYDHVAGPAGNKLVPDLATSVPKPTNGGKTYTFHLKPGIRFGPPLGRAITSRDVAFAMERLAAPKNGGQYAFYYTVIKGWNAFAAGKAKTISGIRTPDSRTIVFDLTQPTGDFLFRMGMPATGPQPPEVAGCFNGIPGAYGGNLVSTGPYMIEGSDKVDATSCAKLVSPHGKPLERAEGYDGLTNLTLVRNPDYDPATDSTAARQDFPDEFRFVVDSSSNDILDKVEAGTLDDEIGAIPPQALEKYETHSDLRHSLHLNSADRTYFLTMNLTQPPFDDIHVRRAMNWIIDKAALIQATGGPTVGSVANHIVPDTLFDNQLVKYTPYRTPGNHGSLARAKAALKGSKYDTAHDGTCSAPECRNVLLIADARAVDAQIVPVIQQDAAKLGITFTVRSINGAYPTIASPAKNVPFAERTVWGKDYADPVTFFAPLFDSHAIIPNGNANDSLVGITPRQCKALGVTGNCTNVPGVDKQLDTCARLAGQPRLGCYESLDRTLMTKVVPWIPYRWSLAPHITSSNVSSWRFDQFGGSIGYAHVAVS